MSSFQRTGSEVAKAFRRQSLKDTSTPSSRPMRPRSSRPRCRSSFRSLEGCHRHANRSYGAAAGYRMIRNSALQKWGCNGGVQQSRWTRTHGLVRTTECKVANSVRSGQGTVVTLSSQQGIPAKGRSPGIGLFLVRGVLGTGRQLAKMVQRHPTVLRQSGEKTEAHRRRDDETTKRR
jgi:hypothetical protein